MPAVNGHRRHIKDLVNVVNYLSFDNNHIEDYLN